MGRWGEIEAKIELFWPDGIDKRPTEADIDRYEAEAGFKLPLDYRRFALAYGPGTLAASHEFEIAVPGMPETGTFGDLATYNPPGGAPYCFRYSSDEELSESYDRDPSWLRHLVFFGFVRDVREQFAWDPSEVTDPAENEMAIYLFGNPAREGVWRVASTFDEFLIDYLLKGRYGRECHPNYENDVNAWDREEPIQYCQYPWSEPTPPPKKKKKKK